MGWQGISLEEYEPNHKHVEPGGTEKPLQQTEAANSASGLIT